MTAVWTPACGLAGVGVGSARVDRDTGSLQACELACSDVDRQPRSVPHAVSTTRVRQHRAPPPRVRSGQLGPPLAATCPDAAVRTACRTVCRTACHTACRTQVLYGHRDPGLGAHAPMADVLAALQPAAAVRA
jgi:hypothetical protein